MTTISLHELRMASTNVDTENNVYSPHKNESSFELSCHGKTERGTICEYIVARQLTQLGYDSEVTISRAEYDIKAQLPHGEAKVEVKSSLLGKSGKYRMGNIKPWLFDYLFLVFVHPTRGIVVKWTTHRRAWNVAHRLSEQMSGYEFGFRDDMSNCQGLKVWDVEDFPYQIDINN